MYFEIPNNSTTSIIMDTVIIIKTIESYLLNNCSVILV